MTIPPQQTSSPSDTDDGGHMFSNRQQKGFRSPKPTKNAHAICSLRETLGWSILIEKLDRRFPALSCHGTFMQNGGDERHQACAGSPEAPKRKDM